MTERPAPKVFISHASEDKERFVLPFARSLRANGIDAWVDKWEMSGGDSLVDRIFREGIGEAEAVVVVVSPASTSKPWVREELDAAVVRRITSATRLIPVILDNAAVPVAIGHLLHYDVDKLGRDGVVQGVVRTMFGVSDKPALGAAPAFAHRTDLAGTGDAIDDVVLGQILETLRGCSPNTRLRDNGIQEAVDGLGISADDYRESMEALTRRGLIRVTEFAGGSYQVDGVADHLWLDDERRRGFDVDGHRQRLLAAIVNGDGRLDFANFDGANWRTTSVMLDDFERDSLLRVHRFADGAVRVSNVSPLARRALRDMS